MILVDSHCHLDASQFDADREEIIQRAVDAGVGAMLTIGTGDGPPDLECAVRIADSYPFIFATAGIHPEHAPNATPADFKHISDLLKHDKCVALGEIGLDFYWEPYDPAKQTAVFVEQLQIAREARKPIIIHTRNAWAQTMAVLREHWAPTRLPCVMHCFTGTPEQAQEAVDLGFLVSFAGVLTFPKAADIQKAATLVPLDRLLVETDSPYLAPLPFRGKRNEPAYVVHTARKLAELRGIDYDSLVAAATANFQRVFLDQLH